MSTANTNNTPAGDGNAAETTTDTAADQDASANTPAAETPATQSGDKPLTPADVERAVKAAQKTWEKQVKDAEAKAKLTEDQRKDAETAELRQQIRERDARDSVKDEAGKLGVKNPSAIYRIVKDDLEFDDKGNVSNLKDVLDAAKTDFPELFDTKPSQSIDAGAGSQGTTSEDSTATDFQKTGRKNSFRL